MQIQRLYIVLDGVKDLKNKINSVENILRYVNAYKILTEIKLTCSS